VRYTVQAVLFSALWARAFVAVKIAVASSPPLSLKAVRFLAAGCSSTGMRAAPARTFS
jgi:drug/metabolite transporter (DMT)-like permease